MNQPPEPPPTPGSLPEGPLGPGLPREAPPDTLPPPRPSRGFWAAIGRLLLFAVLVVVLSVACGIAMAGLPWFEDNDLALSTLVTLPAALGATALLLTVSDMRPPAAVGLPINALGLRHLAFGTAAGAGLSVGIVGLQWTFGWVQVSYGAVEGSLAEAYWAPPLGIGFLVIAGAATSEELLFRGYGLQQLMRATHAWGAMIVSSALFGLVHATNPNSSTVGIVNTALFGVLFGVPLLRQRSLWIPTGMHFGWNFALACMGANISGFTIRLTDLEIVPDGPALWSGAEYGPEASLLTTFAILAAGVLMFRMRLRSNPERVLWERDAPPVRQDSLLESQPLPVRQEEFRGDAKG